MSFRNILRLAKIKKLRFNWKQHILDSLSKEIWIQAPLESTMSAAYLDLITLFYSINDSINVFSACCDMFTLSSGEWFVRIHTNAAFFYHKFTVNSSTEWEALWGRWRPASAQPLGWVEFKLMWSPKTSGVSTVQSFQTIQIMVGLFNIGLGSGRTSTYPGDVSSLGAAYWIGAVVNGF